MNLNERLKIVRETAGLKQPELAEKLGIPVRTYRSYEHGERDISTSTLKSICEILGVSSDFLLGREQPPLTDNQEHLAKLVADTHPEGVSSAVSIALGGAAEARKEKPPLTFDTREAAIEYFKNLPEADFTQLEVFAEYLTYRRTRQPE